MTVAHTARSVDRPPAILPRGHTGGRIIQCLRAKHLLLAGNREATRIRPVPPETTLSNVFGPFPSETRRRPDVPSSDDQIPFRSDSPHDRDTVCNRIVALHH